MPETRQNIEIPLVGYATAEICGNQLPSNKQVLECYFYYTRHSIPKFSAREAAMCVMRKCDIFWEYAGIPIVDESHAAKKMDRLVQQYKSILKHVSRKEKYLTAQVQEIDFKCLLSDLFDIAHQKNVDGMTNKQVITLLSLHREKGRNGHLDVIIDTGTWGLQHTPNEEEESEEIEQVDPNTIAANYGNYLFDEDEDVDELLKQMEDSEEIDSSFEVSLPSTKPKKLKIMSPDITAILDRAKVSDRMAARVLAGIIMTVGITLDDVHLSWETLRRNRQTQRESLSDKIKDNFKNKPIHTLTVHWDGKQLSSPEDKFHKIDRLPVIVSGQDWNQLLGVPRLEKGTGELQAQAVYDCLKEWGVVDNICAMVFDTTASNSGNINGACILLEKLLGKDQLYLACRHHIFELLIRAAFELSMGCTSGPDVQIFKRFQGYWKDIKKEEFSPGVNDTIVKKALCRDAADNLAFAEVQLKNTNIRKDYREFLELVVMFLGGNLTKGNRFLALGPIHHARWMSKAIYSLKIFLFRDQVNLTSGEKSGLRNVCIFIVRLYSKAWFTAPNAVTAPNNDLNLLKDLANTSIGDSISSKIYKVVFEKFLNHLWYLSEELIAFAFFDRNVTVECKRKMCEAIKSRPALDDDKKKRKTEVKDRKFIEQSSLDSFVTVNTIKFFEILKIDCSFLNSDPTTWEERNDFTTALNIVRSLHVTNDVAERSVALVSEYNDLLTKNENSKQNAMLVVQKFRELSSDCTKESLQFSLENYLNNIPASEA